MLKKLLKLFLYNMLGKKGYHKYSSSDYKYRKGGHHRYGHNHYKKKHSSFSFFSS